MRDSIVAACAPQGRNLVSLRTARSARRTTQTAVLTILRHFDFDSQLLRSGVIATDSAGSPEEMVFFVRGAPSSVAQLLRAGAAPRDLHRVWPLIAVLSASICRFMSTAIGYCLSIHVDSNLTILRRCTRVLLRTCIMVCNMSIICETVHCGGLLRSHCLQAIDAQQFVNANLSKAPHQPWPNQGYIILSLAQKASTCCCMHASPLPTMYQIAIDFAWLVLIRSSLHQPLLPPALLHISQHYCI